MSEPTAEKKIVVDEDWKERVRAEREAARAARQGEQGDSTHPPRPSAPPDEFAILVSSLATQAMIALGQFPDPSQGHPVVRPELAKHSIDTLAMLERKTQGNLTAEEARMMDEVLHQLRMLYVAVYRAPQDRPAADGQSPSETDPSAEDAPSAQAKEDRTAEPSPTSGADPAADD